MDNQTPPTDDNPSDMSDFEKNTASEEREELEQGNSSQSPTANGPGQFPEPPINNERDMDEHPRSPKHGETQGREVPGFNHQGYAEATVIPTGDEQTETGLEDEDGLPEDAKKRVPS